MKNSEKTVKKVNIFTSGADSDTNEKYLGATSTQKYIDANNLAVRGKNDKALKFIGGERSLYGTDNAGWECIYTCYVTGHVVEVWVDQLATVTQFRIDGTVMVETSLLGFSANFPLQGDTNDRCDGGEFYITDNQEGNPVYIFNVQDIIDNYNSGSLTYFSLFNPVQYQATLKTSPHHPMFIELVSRSGSGLLVGKYNYSIRYADDTGNKTSWSVQTPNIPVPYTTGLSSTNQPGIKTYGALAGTMSNRGIHLRFRVENVGGYQYIEIRRVAHVDGLQVGFIPTPETMKLIADMNGTVIDIVTDPVQVVDWVDDANLNNEWVELADEEDIVSISGSFTAKTLRYFQNRLIAMNIKYPSKDVESYIPDMFVMKAAKLGFPVIEKLTDSVDRQGFQDVYNQTYFPALQTGEKYGWGVYFMDDFGARSFVVPFDDLAGHSMSSYQMPNRRTPLGAETRLYSLDSANGGMWKGAPIAATIHSNIDLPRHDFVHEVFDLEGARNRADICGFKNILAKGGKRCAKVNDGMFTGCIPGPCVIDVDLVSRVRGEDIGFLPYRPTNDNDADVSGHNFRVNIAVKRECLTVGGSGLDKQGPWSYDPHAFAPNIYSLGMGFWGIKTPPAWARAFSVVRTKPAGRVVCQGIGWLEFKTTEGGGGGATSKLANVLRIYSPDMDSYLTGTVDMDDIADNPLGYKIQLVSPLGAFTEVYDGEEQSINVQLPFATVPFDRGVDMAVYVRQLKEDGTINPNYNTVSQCGNGDGYVSFGRWLNSIASTEDKADIWDNVPDGDHLFSIHSASVVTDSVPGGSGRFNYLRVETIVTEDIYKNLGLNDAHYVAHRPEKFCEPFYIVNIIREDVLVPVGNINQYIETGHLQKIESKIGVSNGNNNQFFVLVDERWEDCIPNYLSSNVSGENRFVYVDGKRWLNVTYKSTAYRMMVLNHLSLSGVHHLTDTDVYGNAVVYDIYGVYFNMNSPGLVDPPYYIQFTHFSGNFDISLFIPADEAEITVRYDNRIPIKLFAGDTVVAENNFIPVDRQGDRRCDKDYAKANQLILGGGWPYQQHSINDRVYIVADAPGDNHIQDNNIINPRLIRQILVNFICESKVNIPYLYGSQYPHIHYIMRPHRWKPGNEGSPVDFLTDNKMDFGGATAYYDTYGFEWNWWQYGGFRKYGFTNIDYQKILNDRVNVSKPSVGWKEKTRFCTRVIWSQKRSINEQDDPNLKSFPSLNVFDISDAYEEIKFAYDNDSSKGNNLFAITGHGTCLLITDKRILSDFTGTEIANMKTETGFIQGEYWISKDYGCNDELWRGIAEYGNRIWIPNKDGVFQMDGLSLKNILRGDVSKQSELVSGQYQRREVPGYYKKLMPYISGVLPGYATPVCAVFDVENAEYLLHIGSVIIVDDSISDVLPVRPEASPARTFIYSADANKEFWSGGCDYDFEKMLYVPQYLNASEKKVFGMRRYQVFHLGVGTIINGETALKNVIFPITPAINQTLEFVDGTVNSVVSPSAVGFAHTLSAMPECQVLEAVLRDYTNAYYFMVPRKDASPNDRLQNDCFIVRVSHDKAEDFSIVSLESGFKVIKW